tara:strand:- start:405 stop:962 length:558 start_codon:yes stop_codon:yes gene_type:complete
MSRKSVMDSNGTPLEDLVEEVVFRPLEEHRKLKSRFLSRIADNPLVDSSSISLAEVQRILGTATVGKYWNLPGFQEWFLNTGEYQERLESLFALALDAAQDILMNQDPKAQSSRAAMVRTMAELAGKMRPKDTGSSAAAAMARMIGMMDQAQLSAFLSKSGVDLLGEAAANRDAIPAQIIIDKPE